MRYEVYLVDYSLDSLRQTLLTLCPDATIEVE